MKLEINQLLKASFNNLDLIKEIPTECLDGYQQRCLVEMAKQLTQGIPPSLESVARSIADELKPNEKPEFLQCIKRISEAQKIDTATQALQMQAARMRASRKCVQILAQLDEDAYKEQQELYARIQQLQTETEERFSPPVSVRDYKTLEQIEQREVELMIDWFRDNNVPIKSKVLYAIITTTNGGKTILKTWLAFELVKVGENILFLAQEEPYQDCVRRIHQQALGLSEEAYHTATKDSFESVGKQYNLLADQKGWGNIWVVEWTNITVDQLKKKIEDFEKEEKVIINGIVIDYAKLIETSSNTKAEWERLGKVFAELKGLAMRMDKYIWTSIQLNREASQALVSKGTTPDLHDVAGAFEATHHVNYALVARLQYDNGPLEEILGNFNLTVQKSKYGKLRKGSEMRFQWTDDHTLTQAPAPTANDVELPYN